MLAAARAGKLAAMEPADPACTQPAAAPVAAAGFTEPPAFTAEAHGNRLTFLARGAERLAALLDLIAGARASLHLCFYIYARDEAGAQVRDALVAAARRGVEVRVLVDGFGADAREAFFADLLQAGGAFAVFSDRWSRRYLVRNHQKMVIADGARAMIGGFNVEESYFADRPDEGWTDLGIVIEGPVAAAIDRWFDQLKTWSAAEHQRWRLIRRMLRDWDPGDGPVQVLLGGPRRLRRGWARTVARDLIRASRLDLMMAYFTPPPRLLHRIAAVEKRGKARLVLAGKSDNGATIGASRSLYSYLLKRGVAIWEFGACKLHTKLIVVDDVCYFGSANFDMRSLLINLELMVRIEDAALAAQLRGFIDGHLAGAEEITPALHRRRATWFNRLRWGASWALVGVVDYTVTRRLNLGQ